MNTTSIFVELVVIGVGATVAVCLMLAAAFGYAWIPVEWLLSAGAAIPVLAFVYLLGILTDRLADVLLGRLWAKGHRLEVYGENGDDYAMDKMLVLSNPDFRRFFEYNKSRQRICRGWTFNAIVILIAFQGFIWARFDYAGIIQIALIGSGLIVLLAAGCWFAGRKLNAVQYKKVKEQAALLRAWKMADAL